MSVGVRVYGSRASRKENAVALSTGTGRERPFGKGRYFTSIAIAGSPPRSSLRLASARSLAVP